MSQETPADTIYNYQIGNIPYTWKVKSIDCPQCQGIHIVPVRDSEGEVVVRAGATILQCLQCENEYPNPNDLVE
jgi:hypothetical protein